jgi:hypothetical protein
LLGLLLLSSAAKSAPPTPFEECVTAFTPVEQFVILFFIACLTINQI